MAISPVLTTLILVLAISHLHPLTCDIVKGSVSCLDCSHRDHLSGIRVLVKCDGVTKMGVAKTEADGSFETELPSVNLSGLNCLAKLVGGPKQLCAQRKNMVSKVVKGHRSESYYVISSPLSFSTTSCPASSQIGSSKTLNVPLPPEWGLAPSSFYLPVLPIIGIP